MRLASLRPRDGKLRALIVLGALVLAVPAVDRGLAALEANGGPTLRTDAAEVRYLESEALGRLAKIGGTFDTDTMVQYGFGGDVVAVQLEGSAGSIVVLTSPQFHPVLAHPGLWGRRLGILGILDKAAEDSRARRGEAEPEPPEIGDDVVEYLAAPHVFTGPLVRPAGDFRLQEEGTVRYRGQDVDLMGFWGGYCKTEGVTCAQTPWVLLEGETPPSRALAALLAIAFTALGVFALVLGLGKPDPRPGFAGALEALRSPLQLAGASSGDEVTVDATLPLHEGYQSTPVTVRGSYRRAPEGRHGSLLLSCEGKALTVFLQGPILRTSLGDLPLVEMRAGHPEIVASTGRVIGQWPSDRQDWAKVRLEALTFDVRTATQGAAAAMVRGPIRLLPEPQAAALLGLCVAHRLD